MTQVDLLAAAAIEYAIAINNGLIFNDWSALAAAEKRMQDIAVWLVLAYAIPASTGAATELDYYTGGGRQ